MSKYDRPFTETNAMLAALNDDRDGLCEILRAMLLGERRLLKTTCYWIASMIEEIQQEEKANNGNPDPR